MGNIIAGAKSMVSARGAGQLAVVFAALVLLTWLGYGPSDVAGELPARN